MLDANTMLDMAQETLLQSPVDVGLTILTLLIFSMVFSVRKIVLGFLRRKHKKNPAHRQWVRTSRYLGLGVSLLLTIPLWIDTLENIGVFVGLLTAALAVSLSSPLQSMAGWVHLIVHQPYRVGDRVQIGNQSGVVQDIALFSTVRTVHPCCSNNERTKSALAFNPGGLLSTALFETRTSVSCWHEYVFSSVQTNFIPPLSDFFCSFLFSDVY